jgi:hypothetical protein
MKIKSYNLSHSLSALCPGAAWILTNDDYSTIEWLSDDIDQPTLAALEAKRDELNAAEPLRALREERDKRIAETDWWASSDRTMTAEQTAYRQALRDLPANTTDPANPVWPVKPE